MMEVAKKDADQLNKGPDEKTIQNDNSRGFLQSREGIGSRV